MDLESYSIDDLAGLVGISPRTVRYYVAEGLLPGPGARGRGARYGSEHLSRLRMIRQWTAQQIPLARIRERLSQLSPSQLRQLEPRQSPRAYLEGLLAQMPAVPPAGGPMALRRAPPPQEESWRRYCLRPGLELSVRSDREQEYRGVVDGIVKLVEGP